MMYITKTKEYIKNSDIKGEKALDKSIRLDLDEKERMSRIAKALSAETRIDIIRLLYGKSYNINEIAEQLKLPQSSAATHVKVLEEAGLIETELVPAVRGSMKVCRRAADSIEFLMKTDLEEDAEIIHMPIGNYVDYYVEPTCGIVSEKGYIDEEDEPRCFYNPARTGAKLLWFGKGYVEYRFSNHLLTNRQLKGMEISMELCSEDHEYNLDYPSDITLWINGLEAGTWTCPSDFGGRRGRLNPSWWPDKNTQFGVLKTWRFTKEGTFLDEAPVSSLPIEAYQLESNGYISVKLGIKPDARHAGGINLFGSSFGDYQQDIRMKLVF
ncbi:Predicted transcriptional regulator [Anaerocolumna jejuensis DSM 15929]|uniref:Predicted transcriptional regulator n=1 Tax=Anaerocolumna jejuensis DSM 15929 TaxID=1121322 RepID=A0A1M6WJ80_9FIRM|nr:helix-turn-helix domain-containing protein [Anaerocolumna jejuensis]SHK93674.1 Predicted transcriptional regulator [Anaerocolumna jejuensis DSM 15929]